MHTLIGLPYFTSQSNTIKHNHDMKTITVNIAKESVTLNNQTCNFIEAGLTTNADPVQTLSDRAEIEEVLNEQYSDGPAFEIIFE